MGQADFNEIARKRKIQSEKKRQWRKNLSPDQRAKRQELDAQRKREQRLNMTPDQRAEARKKDAARKAAKRKLQKEQMRGSDGQSSSAAVAAVVASGQKIAQMSGAPPRRSDGRSLSSHGLDDNFKRSTIEDLLN